MKRLYALVVATVITTVAALGQINDRVQNRPYTDLRKMHFGIVVGTNFQDMELENVGPQVVTLSDGTQKESLVTCDQHNWDVGFNVGVLAEFRLNEYFAFRVAPQLYFGTRNLKFYDFYKKDPETGSDAQQTQTLRSVYVGGNFDLIYASKRHNNHRPYLMAGLAPLFNVSSKSSDIVQLKTADVYFEVGLGCDIYMPFFKLRPELKFMLGLTDCLNHKHADTMRDDMLIPYAKSVSKASSKMIVLSFYFE